MELPGGQLAVLVDAGRRLDQAGRAEVGPGELFFAGPDQLDRLARRPGQPGRLDGGLAGVLAAVAAARVGHDHADSVLGQAERLGQLRPRTEGALGAGPDGQVVALPLRDRRAGLERGVGDVGDRVGRLDLHVGRRQLVLDRAVLASAERSPEPRAPLLGMPLEERRDSSLSVVAGPSGSVHVGWSAARPRRGVVLGRGDDADEVAVADDLDVRASPRPSMLSSEAGAPRRRAAAGPCPGASRAARCRWRMVPPGHE